MRNRKITMLVTLVTACAGCFGILQYRSHVQCEMRGVALNKRIELLQDDAHNQLRVGTKKAEVEHFFRSHEMAVNFGNGYAKGQVNTTGCAPFGCGLDTAIIGVSVKVDSEGNVAAEPQVSSIYTDCL